MNARTEEQVENWPSRPFEGGFRALRELADGSFSGAVRAGRTRLFMLNGRVVGVFDGQIDDFEEASGTLFEAPDPGLVLLYTMQETGGETRGRYYSEDTPLTEVHERLSSSSFTGYVELSENVLSGDYYVVYYGGRSMNVAFVGASEELVTGDEAFETADDEVGIFEVQTVPVEVTDVPEPTTADESAADQSTADATDGQDVVSIPDPEADADEPASPGPAAEPDADDPQQTGPDGPGESPATAEPTPAADAGDASPATDPANASPTPETGTASPDAEPVGGTPDTAGADAPAEAHAEPVESTGVAETRDATAGASTAVDSAGATDESVADASASSGEPAPSQPDEAGTGEEDVFTEEEQWRETRTIPALDPEQSERPAEKRGADRKARAQSQQTERTTASDSSSAGDQSRPASDRRSGGQSPERREASLSDAVETREQELAQLREQLVETERRNEELAAERDRLQSELDAAQAELEELRSELETVRAELEGAGGQAGRAASAGGTDLTPEQALADTTLLVRATRPGGPKLDAALSGSADAEEINKNIRIEAHTQFEVDETTVGGEPFESFLSGTLAHAFVTWVVRELPYEIRDTGHQTGLAELFEAIPEIDRAELGDTVSVETEDGTVERTFDVVLRDKRGRPLIVAQLHDALPPVTGEQMDELITAATDVGEASDLGAAIYVTKSYFKPGALESAEASSGGLFSREKRENFVKVGRKSGYHLCLVEARDSSFHVSIPEL